MFFTNITIIIANLSIISSSIELIQELNNQKYITNNIYERIIKILIKSPTFPKEILEFLFYFLQILKNFRKVLIKSSCLPLLYRIIRQEFDLKDEHFRSLLINTLISILEDNTLTIQ